MGHLSVVARTILLQVIQEFESGRVVRHIKRRIPLDYVLDRIVFVLTTGSQWSHLEVKDGSWKTIYHYFTKWSSAHLFKHAYDHLVSVYLKRNPLTQNIVIDTSFIKNVFGRDCVGPSPFDRGRKATKVSTVVDARGVPLVFTFHRGNRNDSRTLQHTLRKCPVSLCGKSLYADKIYDTQHCHDVLAKQGIHNKISQRLQVVAPADNRVRIVVEHTFAWLDKFRRILMRFDGKVAHLRSWHYLAGCQLISRRCVL